MVKEKEALTKDIKNEEENLPFKEFLNDIEKESSEKVEKLKKIQEKSNTEISDTAVFFGEDPKSFKFNEFIKIIKDFIANFKKSTLKISAEEAKNLKKKIKEEKKAKPAGDNKIVNDLQNMRKSVVRKTQARKTHLKNFKEKSAEIVKNSPVEVPQNNKEEEIIGISPNIIKFARTNSSRKNSQRKTKVRFNDERVTTFAAKDEDINDVDEDKYINNVNLVMHNPTKSATKSKLKINLDRMVPNETSPIIVRDERKSKNQALFLGQFNIRI